MSEYTELTAKIEALEKRVKYLEDTFATLADMNKSSEMAVSYTHLTLPTT